MSAKRNSNSKKKQPQQDTKPQATLDFTPNVELKEEKKGDWTSDPLGPDPHSFANYTEARTKSLFLKLKIDFLRKVMFGYVDLNVESVVDGVASVKFDTKGLLIESCAHVVEAKDGKETETTLCHVQPIHHPTLGLCLSVPVPDDAKKKGSVWKLRVRYQTSENSGGIQWLSAEQTGTKKHPFVYTQCEAILARTLLPCQDTPAVKAPYDIAVSCPPPLVAVCSGNPTSAQPVFEDDGSVTYGYTQSNPIPAYLIAIVCGALVKAKIGPRSSVWAEKNLISASVHEFEADTEKYIKAGEKVTGVSYDWGTYDMVVLPAAFPYGGMENPNLTFLSSSLLAGDRSLTNVVAHEITHSWSGNYVSNANWKDFWLNEGFTVYIERLILGEIHNAAYRDFEILGGYNDLVKTVEDLMTVKPGWTKLQPDINGIDPDDAFSKIPYEKGSLFLLYLEQIVGGATKMQAWLKTYFTTFRTKSLTTSEMKAHFLAHFAKEKRLGEIDWDEWLTGVGLPQFNPKTVCDRSMVAGCEALAKKWIEEDGKGAKATDLKDFLSKQKMYFLDTLITGNKELPHPTLERLDSLYGFSTSQNVEVSFRYLMLALRNKYRPVFPAVGNFLSKHGRGLYTKPLYKSLHKLDKEEASKIYQTNKSFYHSVIRNFCKGLDL